MGATSNAVTDKGRILSGKGSRYTESGSFQIGDKSQYREGGSFGDNATLKTGTDLSGASLDGSTVNIGDPNATKTFAEAIEQLFSNQSQTFGQVFGMLQPTGNTGADNSGAPEADASPKPISKTVKLVIVGAIIAGVIWLFRRK